MIRPQPKPKRQGNYARGPRPATAAVKAAGLAKRKPARPCPNGCGRVVPAGWQMGACATCRWLKSKARRERMAKVEAKRAERIDGEKRRCRRCGLWKHESKFSRVPNGTRRQTCAACYSRAQIVRDKKAGIKRDFAGIDLLSWQEAVRELGGRCAYCVTAVATERDHIIPVSKGGPTELWNLTLACGACNRRKRNILGYFPKLTHSFMRPRDAYPTPKPE